MDATLLSLSASVPTDALEHIVAKVTANVTSASNADSPVDPEAIALEVANVLQRNGVSQNLGDCETGILQQRNVYDGGDNLDATVEPSGQLDAAATVLAWIDHIALSVDRSMRQSVEQPTNGDVPSALRQLRTRLDATIQPHACGSQLCVEEAAHTHSPCTTSDNDSDTEVEVLYRDSSGWDDARPTGDRAGAADNGGQAIVFNFDTDGGSEIGDREVDSDVLAHNADLVRTCLAVRCLQRQPSVPLNVPLLRVPRWRSGATIKILASCARFLKVPSEPTARFSYCSMYGYVSESQPLPVCHVVVPPRDHVHLHHRRQRRLMPRISSFVRSGMTLWACCAPGSFSASRAQDFRAIVSCLRHYLERVWSC